MTEFDMTDMKGMEAEAERKGRELAEIERRNKKRRAKGRPPIMDPIEREEVRVRMRRHRTGDSTTVSGADAVRLFDLRKAQMMKEDDDDDDDSLVNPDYLAQMKGRPEQERKGQAKPLGNDEVPAGAELQNNAAGSSEEEEEKARRAAESARRIQDMKNGRIDHAGNWSESGQKLEGGDSTHLVSQGEAKKAWGIGQDDEKANDEKDEPERDDKGGASGEEQGEGDTDKGKGKGKDKASRQKKKARGMVEDELDEFKRDLYGRLGTSFDAIERTLSDLQGRVAEIVTASAKHVNNGVDASGHDAASEFERLLSRKTPVVFDVGGTEVTFDAITIFYARPCLTLVSKIGSAKITPKPGARLLLTYELDGKTHRKDPVVFLGTRFDLPMFGLSFVGFVREQDADVLDADAGISEEIPSSTDE